MIARHTPIRKRRAKPRRGPLRDIQYRTWLHDKPCACGCGRTPCHAAHTQNNGMRSKGPDSGCAPLYPDCHREYDTGRVAFEVKRGVNMKAMAAMWWTMYQMVRGANMHGEAISNMELEWGGLCKRTFKR